MTKVPAGWIERGKRSTLHPGHATRHNRNTRLLRRSAARSSSSATLFSSSNRDAEHFKLGFGGHVLRRVAAGAVEGGGGGRDAAGGDRSAATAPVPSSKPSKSASSKPSKGSSSGCGCGAVAGGAWDDPARKLVGTVSVLRFLVARGRPRRD